MFGILKLVRVDISYARSNYTKLQWYIVLIQTG